MKRKFITFAVILACFLLQSTVFQYLAFATIKPNMLIVATSSFGFMRGKKAGLSVGFTSGLLVDLFWGGALGFNMLLYSVIGYVNGSFERMFYDDDIKLAYVRFFIYVTGGFCFLVPPDGDYPAGTGVYHSGDAGALSNHITHQ